MSQQQLPNTGNDDSWTTQSFRQSVVAKIEEVIQKSGMNTTRNSAEMENHVFLKAKTKEEYLGFVARLILHVRDIRTPNSQGQNPMMGQMSQQQQQLQQHQQHQQHQQQQQLQQQQQQQMQQQQQQQPNMLMNQMPMQNQMNSQMVNMPPRPPINMNPNFPVPRAQNQSVFMAQQNQSQNAQMPIGGPQGMNQMMSSSTSSTSSSSSSTTLSSAAAASAASLSPASSSANLAPAVSSAMIPNQTPKPITLNTNANVPMNAPNPQLLNSMNMNANSANPQSSKYIEPLQKMIARMDNTAGGVGVGVGGGIGGGGGGGGMPNAQMQTQLLNQMTQMNPQQNIMMQNQMAGMQQRGMGMPPGFQGQRVQNPAYMNANQQPPPVQSPVSINAPSQGMMSQMIPSPALIPSPVMVSHQQPQKSIGLSPSPGAQLNTPGQPIAPNTSPSSAHEDQLYRDKIRQLSKYIEPLQRVIAKGENSDSEKLSKLKKLLEILQSPSQRMPLDTLCKCEMVLERLESNRFDMGFSATPFKDNQASNCLLEVIHNNMHNPTFSHSLRRTFAPVMEVLLEAECKLPPAAYYHEPKKARADPKPDRVEIPGVLQGEIAQMASRFKLALDATQVPASRSVQLLCQLDDKYMPCVPPVSISVPHNYPDQPPVCHALSPEYRATKFLSDVRTAFEHRIDHLPKFHTVTQLMDSWEMSVRQASCASYNRADCDGNGNGDDNAQAIIGF